MIQNPNSDVKRRVYDILELTDPEDRATESVNFFLMVLVIMNVAAVVLETVESIYRGHARLFQQFIDFSLIVFTIEYLLRIWSCNSDEKYSHPIFGRMKYALTFFALIDLMVILPIYMIYIIPDYKLLRSIRVLWAFRLLKLSRYSKSFVDDHRCGQGTAKGAGHELLSHNLLHGSVLDCSLLSGA